MIIKVHGGLVVLHIKTHVIGLTLFWVQSHFLKSLNRNGGHFISREAEKLKALGNEITVHDITAVSSNICALCTEYQSQSCTAFDRHICFRVKSPSTDCAAVEKPSPLRAGTLITSIYLLPSAVGIFPSERLVLKVFGVDR